MKVKSEMYPRISVVSLGWRELQLRLHALRTQWQRTKLRLCLISRGSAKPVPPLWGKRAEQQVKEIRFSTPLVLDFWV